MLELHRASVNQSSLNPLAQSVPPSGTPGAKSTATSFMDVLAGVQNESLVPKGLVQNETPSSAEIAAKPNSSSPSSPDLVSEASMKDLDDQNDSSQPIEGKGNTASDSSHILMASAGFPANPEVSLATKADSSANHSKVSTSSDSSTLAAQQQGSAQSGLVKSAPGQGFTVKPTAKLKQRIESATGESSGIPSTELPGLGSMDSSVTGQSTALNEAVVSGPARSSISVTSTAKAKTGEPSGGLAFAVRILGTGADDLLLTKHGESDHAPAADLVEPDAATASNPLVQQLSGMLRNPAAKIAQGEALPAGSGFIGSAASLNIGATVISPSALGQAHGEPPADQAAPAQAMAEDQPAHAQSVKTVQLQITGADNLRVDMKLIEKSGALTMSVRSGDGALTRALQQNLPDLASKLSDQQIRAEWWRPDAPLSQATQKPGDSSGNGSNSAAQDQRGQNKENSGQQGGRGAPQPEWLDELASPRKSNQNGA